MKPLQVTEQNKPYYSADYTKGFNDGAKAQYEADKKDTERQGRWIDGNEGKWNTVILPKCSVCHTPFYGIETERYHYCPNCGARMEVE